LARQVEVEEALFVLIVASFERLSPGSGRGVLFGKKEKLANAICPVMVFSILHAASQARRVRE